jgi:major membrane immunogen (membrane-anchored lipoprotein)
MEPRILTNKMLSRVATLGILVLALLLCACGGSHRDIVGKWRAPGEPNPTIWEFSSNGGVKIGTIQGRYSFGDGDRIKIETRTGNVVYQLEIIGEQMVLKDPHGSKIELTRFK